MITNDKYVVHTTFSINMITIDTGNHVLMAAKVELGGGYLGTPKFWVFYRNENLKKNGLIRMTTTYPIHTGAKVL